MISKELRKFKNTKQHYRGYFRESYSQKKKTDKHNRESTERISLTRRVDKKMRIRKESSILTHKTIKPLSPVRGKRNEHGIFKTTRRKQQNDRTSTYLSTITFNVNVLTFSTKRCRLTEWIKKQDPTAHIACKKLTSPAKTHRLKGKG